MSCVLLFLMQQPAFDSYWNRFFHDALYTMQTWSLFTVFCILFKLCFAFSYSSLIDTPCFSVCLFRAHFWSPLFFELVLCQNLYLLEREVRRFKAPLAVACSSNQHASNLWLLRGRDLASFQHWVLALESNGQGLFKSSLEWQQQTAYKGRGFISPVQILPLPPTHRLDLSKLLFSQPRPWWHTEKQNWPLLQGCFLTLQGCCLKSVGEVNLLFEWQDRLPSL